MMQRKAPPTHGQIVRYWIIQEKSGRPAPWGFFDWGEPACFACGLHDPRGPVWEEARDPSAALLSGLWNAHSHVLERCHIVPRCRGGSYEPSNFVLMCHECHRISPEGDIPADLFAWMKNCPGSCEGVHWTHVQKYLEAVKPW